MIYENMRQPQDTPNDEDDDPEGVDVSMTRLVEHLHTKFKKKCPCLHPTIMDLGRMQHPDFVKWFKTICII